MRLPRVKRHGNRCQMTKEGGYMELLVQIGKVLVAGIASVVAIVAFWFGVKMSMKSFDESEVKFIKVVLYGFITLGTMYDFLWKPGSNTSLNIFIFLVSFFEIYSNADEIIFLFRSQKKIIKIGEREYKVRIKCLEEGRKE